MITKIQESIRSAFRQPLDYGPFSTNDILDYFFQSALVPLVKAYIETSKDQAGSRALIVLITDLGNAALGELIENTARRIQAGETFIPGAPVEESDIPAELYKELPDGLDVQSGEASRIRAGVSGILQVVGAVELVFQAVHPAALNSLKEKIILFSKQTPEFAWMEGRAAGYVHKENPAEAATKGTNPADLDALALMHISPAEMMTSQPAGLTLRQQELVLAIQNWHKGEIARSEQRITRYRWLARGLVIGLLILLVVIVGVGLYSIRTTMVSRANAALAETNAVMAGDIARIAATDVVAASTAKVVSTQSLATAQVASTAVVQLNADQLAAQALSQTDQQLDLALLLSLEAYRHLDTSKTRNALFSALTTQPAIDRLLGGRSGAVLSVAYSPDGKTVATGGTDDAVLLYTENSGKTDLVSLSGHTDAVYALAFSPDGSLLASGSKNGKIIVWDTQTRQPALDGFSGHVGAVYALAFNADGTRLVSGGEDKSVRTWDVKTGLPFGEPKVSHKQSVTTVSFAPDGKSFASAGLDANVFVWDAKSGAVLNKLNLKTLGPAWSSAYSPDGRFLAVAGNDHAVHVWDFKRASELPKPLLGHQGAVLSVAFAGDGNLLVSGGEDGIYLWKIGSDASGNPAFEPEGQNVQGHSGPVKSLALSADGKSLASGSSSDRTTILWNVPALLHRGIAGGQELSGHTEPVSSLAFRADGMMLASGSWDKTIKIWDLSTTASLIGTLEGHQGYVMGVAFSPDGKYLASASVDNTIRVWDAQTLQPVGAPLSGHAKWVRSLAFSPDGKTLASSSWDQTVRLWDTHTWQPLTSSIQDFSGPVYVVAFSPQGDLLLTGSDSTANGLAAWMVKDLQGAAPTAFKSYGSERTIYALAVDESGKILAAGGTQRTISLWDVQSGLEVRTPFIAHSGDILSLAFQPEGKILASGSSDTQIRLWDMETGTLLGQPLTGHKDFVYALAFHPQGKMLASGGADNMIYLWDTDAQSWVERACRKAGRNLSQGEWAKFFGDVPYQKTCPNNP